MGGVGAHVSTGDEAPEVTTGVEPVRYPGIPMGDDRSDDAVGVENGLVAVDGAAAQVPVPAFPVLAGQVKAPVEAVRWLHFQLSSPVEGAVMSKSLIDDTMPAIRQTFGRSLIQAAAGASAVQ